MKILYRKCCQPFRCMIITQLVAFLTACDSENEFGLNSNTFVFNEFPEEVEVRLANLIDFHTGTVYAIFPLETALILFDIEPKSNTVFHYFDLQTNQFTNSYLTRGNGPNEVRTPFSTGIRANELWAHDVFLKKVVTLENSIGQIDSLRFKEFFLSENYSSSSMIGEKTLLGTGNSNTGSKVQMIDLETGEVTREFGEFENIPDEMPTEVLKQVYQSFVFAKPTGDKFALIYRFTDAIELFDLSSGENLVIHGPEKIEIAYNIARVGENQSFMERTNETRQAFMGGAVTDRYIYALYSGGLIKGSASQLGKHIYVYDWAGKPVKKINLDTEILSFAVASDDKTIYAFDTDAGFVLWGEIN